MMSSLLALVLSAQVGYQTADALMQKATMDMLHMMAFSRKTVRHHSLNEPFLTSPWEDPLPFWRTAGDAVITDKYIRLTPDKPDRYGSLSNLVPNEVKSWDLIVDVTIGKQHKSSIRSAIGGDGVAIWYKKDFSRDYQRGSILGGPSKFTGVGILIDTYDNNVKYDKPSISIITQDKDNAEYKATPAQDYLPDGFPASRKCSNKILRDKEAVKVNISYRHRVSRLYVTFAAESTPCASVSFADLEFADGVLKNGLPTGYFFGVTADTGGVSDNHDISSLRLYPRDCPGCMFESPNPDDFRMSDVEELPPGIQRQPEDVTVDHEAIDLKREEAEKKVHENPLSEQHNQMTEQRIGKDSLDKMLESKVTQIAAKSELEEQRGSRTTFQNQNAEQNQQQYQQQQQQQPNNNQNQQFQQNTNNNQAQQFNNNQQQQQQQQFQQNNNQQQQQLAQNTNNNNNNQPQEQFNNNQQQFQQNNNNQQQFNNNKQQFQQNNNNQQQMNNNQQQFQQNNNNQQQFNNNQQQQFAQNNAQNNNNQQFNNNQQQFNNNNNQQ